MATQGTVVTLCVRNELGSFCLFKYQTSAAHVQAGSLHGVISESK